MKHSIPPAEALGNGTLRLPSFTKTTSAVVGALLLAIGPGNPLIAQEGSPANQALRKRGLAFERYVNTNARTDTARFINEHVAPATRKALGEEQLAASLEEIRKHCRNAGGVLWKDAGDRTLDMTFEQGPHMHEVTLAVSGEPPYWIETLKQKASRSTAPHVEVAPMNWNNMAERLEEEAGKGFSGVVLAARDGRIVLHRGFGLANREKRIPNTTNTVFAIGSTPIDFTHAAILKLVDLGKLTTSDRITRFLKDVPADKQAITLQHLMTGRSGLKNFHGIPGVDDDLDLSWIDRETALRRILGSELLFAPGTAEAHSHSAWGVLAAVIEIASDQSYADFLQEHLFEPAGMTRTGLYPITRDLDPDQIAVGYGANRIPPLNAPQHWGRTSWLVMGSGGMVSTAADLYRWNRAVLGGNLLSPESTRRYGGGDVGAGGNDRGFFTLYTQTADTMVIVCTNSHEGPRDHAAGVARATVSVTRSN